MQFQVSENCDNCFDCIDVCDRNAILRPGDGYETDEADFEPLSYVTVAVIADRCDGCGEGAEPRCVQACKPAAITPLA